MATANPLEVAFSVVPVPVPTWSIVSVITNRLPQRPPGQTGAVLKDVPELQTIMVPLTAMISRMFGCKMYLRLDKSSYRLQPPDGDGALPLHQDYIPLQDPITSRFHWGKGIKHTLIALKEGLPYLSDPTQEPSCTVWLPLTPIDRHTPTLEASPVLPFRFIPHKTDAAGYAILADDTGYRNWPLAEFSQMPSGYGVLMHPLTLHRSAIRPHHTKERRSMDLRFLPRPQK